MKIKSSSENPVLDVIEMHPKKATKKSLLFIHGANMSGWCWNENFMPFFTELGHPCYAISLRGHGKSGGHHNLATFSIADYVNDIERVIDELPEAPILIGHSLGGLLIQKYIETKTVPACVLLAPVPVGGLLPPILDLAMYNPSFYTQFNLTQLFGTWASAVDITRQSIFSGHVSDEVVIRYCAQMQPESPKALMDSIWLGLPDKTNPFDIPMLALAADEDSFFRPSHIKETADAYKADYINMEGTSHVMMLDSQWHECATTIQGWLAKFG